MKTAPFALAVAGLALASALLAAAPLADARQICTDLRQDDPTCPGWVCVWNHLEGRWSCVPEPIYCVTDPCWDPTLP